MILDLQAGSTVLAALRYYQREGQGDPANRDDWTHDLATSGGDAVSLDAEGIDALCVAFNLGEIETPEQAETIEKLKSEIVSLKAALKQKHSGEEAASS